MDNQITIGKVSKAQGIKGEVKITIISDEKEIFKKLKRVYLNGKPYNVENIKFLANGIFFKLEGIDDRNTAELLKGSEVTCDKADMPKLPKGRYLIEDILNSKVIVNNEWVGIVNDILQNGSADVYCITGTNGHKSFMFPCLKKVLVKVDVDSKEIHLDNEVLEQIALYED